MYVSTEQQLQIALKRAQHKNFKKCFVRLGDFNCTYLYYSTL